MVQISSTISLISSSSGVPTSTRLNSESSSFETTSELTNSGYTSNEFTTSSPEFSTPAVPKSSLSPDLQGTSSISTPSHSESFATTSNYINSGDLTPSGFNDQMNTGISSSGDNSNLGSTTMNPDDVTTSDLNSGDLTSTLDPSKLTSHQFTSSADQDGLTSTVASNTNFYENHTSTLIIFTSITDDLIQPGSDSTSGLKNEVSPTSNSNSNLESQNLTLDFEPGGSTLGGLNSEFSTILSDRNSFYGATQDGELGFEEFKNLSTGPTLKLTSKPASSQDPNFGGGNFTISDQYRIGQGKFSTPKTSTTKKSTLRSSMPKKLTSTTMGSKRSSLSSSRSSRRTTTSRSSSSVKGFTTSRPSAKTTKIPTSSKVTTKIPSSSSSSKTTNKFGDGNSLSSTTTRPLMSTTKGPLQVKVNQLLSSTVGVAKNLTDNIICKAISCGDALAKEPLTVRHFNLTLMTSFKITLNNLIFFFYKVTSSNLDRRNPRNHGSTNQSWRRHFQLYVKTTGLQENFYTPLRIENFLGKRYG